MCLLGVAAKAELTRYAIGLEFHCYGSHCEVFKASHHLALLPPPVASEPVELLERRRDAGRRHVRRRHAGVVDALQKPSRCFQDASEKNIHMVFDNKILNITLFMIS